MFRKTKIVLATTAVLSGGLTANAVALAAAHTGWDGLGDGGAHAIVPPPARDQRLQPSERRYDPWGIGALTTAPWVRTRKRGLGSGRANAGRS
jgi:hypothetical protein